MNAPERTRLPGGRLRPPFHVRLAHPLCWGILVPPKMAALPFPPSAIPICMHHLCYPKVHGRGKASSEGRWNPLPSSMGPMRGHHSEERPPARFSVLRRLQLHSILPSIYLNPFLTIPRFYPFTFNSNPQAILKGWAVDWCLWSGVPGARGTGCLAQGTPGRPSSALTNWLHAHGLGSGACKVKST